MSIDYYRKVKRDYVDTDLVNEGCGLLRKSVFKPYNLYSYSCETRLLKKRNENGNYGNTNMCKNKIVRTANSILI